MDTQPSTHISSSSYAYVSPRFPCFYDAWVHYLFGSKSIDTEVYLSQLPYNNKSPVIVDLFTGSGRVLKEIIASGRAPGATLYGIDHSPAMLARASTTTAPTGGVKWRCASATSFASALDDDDGGAKADLLIASAGSVSHLIHRDEVRGLLTEVARALAVSGVAVVSVLAEMLAETAGAGEDDIGLLTFPCEDDGEGRKGRWVKSPTVATWDGSGRVRVDTFQVEFYEDGVEQVVWREELKWSLATFDEDQWAADVAEAQLEIAEIVPESEVNGQRFYVLKKALTG